MDGGSSLLRTCPFKSVCHTSVLASSSPAQRSSGDSVLGWEAQPLHCAVGPRAVSPAAIWSRSSVEYFSVYKVSMKSMCGFFLPQTTPECCTNCQPCCAAQMGPQCPGEAAGQGDLRPALPRAPHCAWWPYCPVPLWVPPSAMAVFTVCSSPGAAVHPCLSQCGCTEHHSCPQAQGTVTRQPCRAVFLLLPHVSLCCG